MFERKKQQIVIRIFLKKGPLERFLSKIDLYAFICAIFFGNDEFQFVVDILRLINSTHQSNMLLIFTLVNDVQIITMEFMNL